MNTTTRTNRRTTRAIVTLGLTALTLGGSLFAAPHATTDTAKPRITRVAVHPGSTARRSVRTTTTTTGTSNRGPRTAATDISDPGHSHRGSDVHTLDPAESRRSRAERAPMPPKRDFGDVYGNEDELGERTAGRASTTTPVSYRGGAVQTSPHLYLVFWGSSWTTSAGDPYGVANRLHHFYGGVGGSGWANTLKQYTSAYGSFTNPTGEYRGWLRDTTAVPAYPTQAQVAAVAQRAAVRVGDYSYNAQYVVAMPWGTIDTATLNSRFCAWHYYTRMSSTSWITYTAMPYTPYLDRLYRTRYGVNCGGGRVTGDALDGVTINAAHEYAETVSDPSVSGWYDASGAAGEVGDKCAWTGLGTRTLANGYAFPVQPIWSNSYFRVYGTGCRL